MEDTSPWSWIGPLILVVIFMGVTIFWCLWLRIEKKKTAQIIVQQQEINHHLRDYNPRRPKVFLSGDIGKSIRNSFRRSFKRLKTNNAKTRRTETVPQVPYNPYDQNNSHIGRKNEAYVGDNIDLQPIRPSYKESNHDISSVSSASSQKYLYRRDDLASNNKLHNPNLIRKNNQYRVENTSQNPSVLNFESPPIYEEVPRNYAQKLRNVPDGRNYPERQFNQPTKMLNTQPMIHNSRNNLTHRELDFDPNRNQRTNNSSNLPRQYDQSVTPGLSLNVGNLSRSPNVYQLRNGDGETII